MTAPAVTLTEPLGPAGGPLLVLAHSLGTGPLLWELALPALAARYRVSLLTLPGHGRTPVPAEPFTMDELADATADAIRGVSDEPVLYAGVSIGGALGLALASRHPEVLVGAAIIAAGAEMGTPEHWRARAALVREQSTSVLLIPSAKSWFAPDSIARHPDLTGRILHALQGTDDEGYARCAEALATYDVRDRLDDIRVPLLAVWGEHDAVAPETKQDEIVRHVAGSRAVRIDDAGHQPPAEQPEAVASALLAFADETVRAREAARAAEAAR